jgi:hypothetical protein
MEGGFWRTDGNFDPILHLKNILLKQPLDVAPSIIFADGAEFPLPEIHLEPEGVVSINIKLALHGAPTKLQSHISEFGMAAISYHWSWSAVIASIQNTDEIASLSNVSSTLATTSVVHKNPEDTTPRTLRGTWWKPTSGSDYVLAIGNTSLTGKSIQILISDHLGNPVAQKSIQLASHRMNLLRLNDLLAASGTTDTVGDVTILFSGPKFGVLADASIEDPTVGYSVTPHIFETVATDDPAQPITVDAPGLMVGKPDPGMLFPVGTSFMPYAVLHNVTSHSVATTLFLTSDATGSQTATRQLDSISLSPGQSVKLDMTRYFGSSNPLPDGYAHLSLSYTGQYRDVIIDTGSADQTGSYVFQVQPSGEAPTTSKIFCYWTVEGDSSTMVSIWNYSRKPQDATLVLYFSGGQYRIPVHLEARKSYNLDLMTLVRSRAPDPDGNLIPSNIVSGSAELWAPDGELGKMNVVVSSSGYNVRNATCFPMCINCGGLTQLYLSPYTTIDGVGQSAQVYGYYSTSSGGPYSLGGGGTWSSSNTSIATINSGSMYGQAPGSVSLLVELSSPPGETVCYNSDEGVCADQFVQGSGGGSVYPSITAVSPMTYGGTGPLIISGNGFQTYGGSVKIVFSNPGITVGTPAVNGNQITSTYRVACGVQLNAAGTVLVESPADGGSNPTAPFPVTVDLPSISAPTINFNGNPVTGTQSVVAGQQIALTGSQSIPNCMSLQSQTWSQPTGGTAVAGYSPTTSSASVSLITPTNPSPNTSSYTFYGVYNKDSLTTSYHTLLATTSGDGITKGSPATTTQFNVTAPTGGTMSVTPYLSQIYVANLSACSNPSLPGGPYMIYAQDAVGSACPGGAVVTAVGINFNSPTGYQNASGGQFLLVQLISSDVRDGAATSAGLDTLYPYGHPPSSDSPAMYLSSTSSSHSRALNANMFLMWQSSKASSIPVPLGYQTWTFAASATCSTNCGTANSWTISTTQATPLGAFEASLPTQKSVGNNVLVDGIPTWTGPSQ